MTYYYQVEFRTETASRREPKRFRTEEKAKKHARKVLGIADGDSLESQATILPVTRNRTSLL
jgi:hypothetical protein